MVLTIDNILDEIVEEVGGDTADTTFKTLMLRFLKEGIRHVPAFIKSRLFIALGTRTLAATSTSVSLSALSPGFIAERSVWWVTTENKRDTIFRANSHHHFNSIYNPAATGSPRIYRVYDKTMEFDRTADQSYTIGIEYFKEVSAVTTTDTFFGDDSLLSAVKHFCKMVYYGDYEEDSEKRDKHEDQGGAIIRQLQGDYEAQEMGGQVEASEDIG
jgi:hypothetical protein